MINWKDSALVAIEQSAGKSYPEKAPFHSAMKYPELGFMAEFEVDATNQVYASVRALLAQITGKEITDAWNPLAEIVKPGDTVVIKPNLVRENHEIYAEQWQQVITHGSVIRAVCDYVLLALDGKGEVIICDAPQTDSSFENICRNIGLNEICDWYASFSPVKVSLLDLRKECWQSKNDVIVERQPLAGDPKGYIKVDLAEASEFFGVNPKHGFYGADYDTSVTAEHHHDNVHEYLLSGTVLKADVVINIPKLKTHKKTGITCAIKNLVGINGDKNWLPHYMLGNPEDGGDQFAKKTLKTGSERVLMTWFKKKLYHSPTWVNHLFRPVKKVGRIIFGSTHKVVRSGNWHGNDTTWRMSVDLNKCMFYYQNDKLVEQSTRRYLTIVDGIVAGEGEGPLAPDALACGVLLGGLNPVAVDAASATLMGFDIDKLLILTGAFSSKKISLASFKAADVIVKSNNPAWNHKIGEMTDTFHFKSHFGWEGKVELEQVKNN